MVPACLMYGLSAVLLILTCARSAPPEAAQAAVRFDPEWHKEFSHLAMRRERKIAKVAMARKLAVSLYWMWRRHRNSQMAPKIGSYAG